MVTLFSIGIGGACGAVARYYLGCVVMGKMGGGFPLGTFLVNVSGAFALCFMAAAAASGHTLPPPLEAALATGFLGAYTTFSTYAFETVKLLEDQKKMTAFGYAFSTIVFGLAAGGLGYLAGTRM